MWNRKVHDPMTYLADVDMKVDVFVGRRIRYGRTALGLTQPQLAAKLKITYQQLHKYETGKNRVSSSRLFEIGQVLGVDVSFFFEGLDRDGDSTTNVEDFRFYAIIRNFNRIADPTSKRKLVAFCEAVARRRWKPDP